MCFRPADVGSMLTKVKCGGCGAEVLAGIKCPKCGFFNEKVEEAAPAPGAPGAPGVPVAPGAPSAPGAPKAPGA